MDWGALLRLLDRFLENINPLVLLAIISVHGHQNSHPGPFRYLGCLGNRPDILGDIPVPSCRSVLGQGDPRLLLPHQPIGLLLRHRSRTLFDGRHNFGLAHLPSGQNEIIWRQENRYHWDLFLRRGVSDFFSPPTCLDILLPFTGFALPRSSCSLNLSDIDLLRKTFRMTMR